MTEENPIRVLVIDDDDDDVFLIRAALARIEGASYAIRRTRDFENGLAMLAERAHDVCLLDYRLGARDGLELLDESLRRGETGPFVMLTGQDSRRLDLDAMRRGAADFISKARIDKVTLERAIRYAVERARADAELRNARDQLEVRVEQRTAELKAAREEAERLYREAQEASRLKDDFLATVSHELRTPLHVILGHADLLMSDHDLPADVAESVEIILRNAMSQTRLVDDLLDVSRIVSGKLDLMKQEVRLDHTVRAAFDSLRLDAERRQVSLILSVEIDGAWVYGDPARLHQIATNILSNALKFTPKGGRVSVTLKPASRDHVELRVVDTGKGIQPEFLPYIFQRFRQEDSSIRRSHGGLGLGLSIAQHLVKAHDGFIDASSEGLGKGSTFVVTLPLLR